MLLTNKTTRVKPRAQLCVLLAVPTSTACYASQAQYSLQGAAKARATGAPLLPPRRAPHSALPLCSEGGHSPEKPALGDWTLPKMKGEGRGFSTSGQGSRCPLGTHHWRAHGKTALPPARQASAPPARRPQPRAECCC